MTDTNPVPITNPEVPSLTTNNPNEKKGDELPPADKIGRNATLYIKLKKNEVTLPPFAPGENQVNFEL